MRVGQKNKLTYRWARKGSRPRAIHDQRTQSTYLFGAVCPERGAGAALVLPACNTEAMQLHLDEIATKVTPGAHAVLILDQAGSHGAKDLKAPKNISLLPLPPRAPELRPSKKTSGSSCGRTGCRTAFSNPSTKSSTTAATRGTRSSINPGKSCPSLAAISGQSPVNHCEGSYTDATRMTAHLHWPHLLPGVRCSLSKRQLLRMHRRGVSGVAISLYNWSATLRHHSIIGRWINFCRPQPSRSVIMRHRPLRRGVPIF